MRKPVKVSMSLCVAAMALAAAALTGPPKGSVEWHKREYSKARDGSYLRVTLRKVFVRRRVPDQERIDRVKRHYAALINLGYLREQVFYVSNRLAEHVVDTVWLSLRTGFTNQSWDFAEVTEFGTNSITVTGPSD